MEKELNWAVIGTGVIANEMAQTLQKIVLVIIQINTQSYCYL